MVKVSYDRGRNVVILEFSGKIDAAQARRSLAELERILPREQKGFKLLADYSSLDKMDVDVEEEIIKVMRLFSSQGVTEILRVLPDPTMDVGFDILSRSYYSTSVKRLTFRSLSEATAQLPPISRPKG